MEFEHKVVVITGASSGIGAACAVEFAKLSAKLSLISRNKDKLTKVGDQCQKINGLKPMIIIADISVEEDVNRIVEETINHFGKIDILVNNAGTCVMGKTQNGIEAFDRVMGTNVRGTFLLTDKIIPHLIKSKGNIVNISSILSTKPLSSMTAYCISKAALDMFTQCVALELGPKGVRVNSVNPGAIKTNLFVSAGLSKQENDEIFQFYEKVAPLQKIAKVEDVANIVVFLASDRAKCVTGSKYVVDCGAIIAEGLLN
ncbi:unnamed protein product [Diatraea saccharalis]|uniref:Uncharacterized protein n=1 Tax=Diatraea saccharalis TaxID=40085 RepID=A0A9N9WFH8_9NEOP|nr:unnamed protein product [Diatraea saccharalis]